MVVVEEMRALYIYGQNVKVLEVFRGRDGFFGRFFFSQPAGWVLGIALKGDWQRGLRGVSSLVRWRELALA